MSIAQQNKSAEITKRIETYLTEFEKLGFAGTVLIELDGTKVISKAYGFRECRTQRKKHAKYNF